MFWLQVCSHRASHQTGLTILLSFQPSPDYATLQTEVRGSFVANHLAFAPEASPLPFVRAPGGEDQPREVDVEGGAGAGGAHQGKVQPGERVLLRHGQP